MAKTKTADASAGPNATRIFTIFIFLSPYGMNASKPKGTNPPTGVVPVEVVSACKNTRIRKMRKHNDCAMEGVGRARFAAKTKPPKA